MSTTRRGFLGSLLALPVVARLVPFKAEATAHPSWLPEGNESFDQHMKRNAERYLRNQREKYAPGRANPIPCPGIRNR